MFGTVTRDLINNSGTHLCETMLLLHMPLKLLLMVGEFPNWMLQFMRDRCSPSRQCIRMARL